MIYFLRAVVFLLMACVYWLSGWVNWQQSGMLALLGCSAVMMVTAWTRLRGGETSRARLWVLLAVIPFIVFLGFHAFLREFLGVSADEGAVCAAIFSSDREESVEFIKHYALPILEEVVIVVVFIAAYALFLRYEPPATRIVAGPRPWWRGVMIAGIFTLVFVLLHMNGSLRRHNPVLYFPIRYTSWTRQVENMRQLRSELAGIDADTRLNSMRLADERPRTVVFVLGESVTRRNFSFAGYARKTTPQLDAMGAELVWFSDVVSSDPSTVPALQKILTPSTLAEPDLWKSKPDVFRMARKAGYKTFWISNHSTDWRGIALLFAENADKKVLSNRGDSRGEGSYDEVVLPILEEALRDPSPHKFILVHLLNAHPAYYFRYPKPFARFNEADDAVARELKAAGRAFWAVNNRNYYDNAILYMDEVLKRSIELCRASAQPVAWLYVPDHGEDVAHYSNYCGHNARVLSQYEVPMVFWRSPSFAPLAVEDAQLRQRPYQLDFLDHTLLGMMGIVGDYYEPERDIFSEAFKPWPRTIWGEPYGGPDSPELNRK